MRMSDQFAKSKPLTASATAPVRLLAWVPGVFMLLFLAVGLLLALATPTTRRPPQGGAVLSGEWAAQYQAAFEEQLPLRPVAVHSWTALIYTVFREGRQGVLIGTEGWLFTTEEFALDPKPLQVDVATIEAVRDALAHHGAALVIALVPAKARVYEAHLGRYTLPPAVRDRYQVVLSELHARGIIAPDLLAALSEAKAHDAVFLRTDTHWTPYGAAVSAEALAQALEGLRLPFIGEDTFKTHLGEVRRFEGDLFNFLPLGPLGHLGPKPDKLTTVETVQTSGNPLGLFDEVTIPVTLVGTSYSAGRPWNFDGALKEVLGADVLNVAAEGQGPLVPMQRYLDSPRFADAPPALVIWEIPERYVVLPQGL